jgi:hypothetical protein
MHGTMNIKFLEEVMMCAFFQMFRFEWWEYKEHHINSWYTVIPWLMLSWLTLLCTCVMCLQTPYSKPSVQIHTYGWYWGVFEFAEPPWIGSHTRPSRWNSEASAIEEAKNAEEPAAEPKEQTMALMSLTGGLGLIKLPFRCADIYSSEQWAATSREGCIRMLAC